MSPRIVEVRQGILKKNDLVARTLRERFAGAGTAVVNLLSSPGAGKTALLEETLRALSARRRVAALVGDLATDNDARRLAASGAPSRQITTGTLCHLEAEMVERALDGWDLEDLDLLFVENVGNLVCPGSYDLGETARVVLLSVTEGEDKPLKYPTIFNTADLVAITKADLSGATAFRREDAIRNVRRIRPNVEILELSARSGQGLERWFSWLEGLVPAGRPREAEVPAV